MTIIMIVVDIFLYKWVGKNEDCIYVEICLKIPIIYSYNFIEMMFYFLSLYDAPFDPLPPSPNNYEGLGG